MHYCNIERRNNTAESRQLMRDQESTKGTEMNSIEMFGNKKWRRGLLCSEKFSMRYNIVLKNY